MSRQRLSVVASALIGLAMFSAFASADNPPGRNLKVGRIMIVGNEVVPSEVILEQASLFPGQAVTEKDLRKAEEQLASIRFFKARPKLSMHDPDPKVQCGFKDIVIRVEEKSQKGKGN